MAFRTRRQERYVALRKKGFLKFEANDLSKVPFSTPYMKALISERNQKHNAASKRKISQTQWEQSIKLMYFDMKWRTKTKSGNIKYDVWQMLREFEEQYKQKHPQYQSPWQKKRKGWKDFVSKVEKTLQKQEGQQ